MKGHEVGDSIHGHRIIAEARRVSDPVVIVKSARHKAQRIVLTENALAIIDRKGRWSGLEWIDNVHSRREFKSAIALMIGGE